MYVDIYGKHAFPIGSCYLFAGYPIVSAIKFSLID